MNLCLPWLDFHLRLHEVLESCSSHDFIFPVFSNGISIFDYKLFPVLPCAAGGAFYILHFISSFRSGIEKSINSSENETIALLYIRSNLKTVVVTKIGRIQQIEKKIKLTFPLRNGLVDKSEESHEYKSNCLHRVFGNTRSNGCFQWKVCVIACFRLLLSELPHSFVATQVFALRRNARPLNVCWQLNQVNQSRIRIWLQCLDDTNNKLNHFSFVLMPISTTLTFNTKPLPSVGGRRALLYSRKNKRRPNMLVQCEHSGLKASNTCCIHSFIG